MALRRIIVTKKVGHLFEADIRYFNHIQHDWLQRMVAHRIADPLILRLIGKWLNAGFMMGGVVTRTEEGPRKGAWSGYAVQGKARNGGTSSRVTSCCIPCDIPA